MKSKRLIILAFISLLTVSLACNLPVGFQDSADQDPIQAVVTDTVDNRTLIPDPNQSATPTPKETSPASITLTLDEEQINTIILSELQKQENQIIRDPKVDLQDGQIEITGSVLQGGFWLPLRLVMTVTADEQGKIHYEVTEGTIGPFPLPEVILDELSEQLDTALANQIVTDSSAFHVEEITVEEGLIRMQGYPK